MRPKRSVRDAPLKGRRVLVRVDFNVPLTPQGGVADPRRIAEAIPTLQHLQAAGAKTILLSHLGRPGGRRDPRLSLRPVGRKLSEMLGLPVPLAEDCVGIAALNATSRLKNGDLLLLENLRFHAGEESNDPAFAAELAQLGELFVEEAFGTVHRAHASTVGVPRRLPAFAGFLVERETRELSRLIDRAEHPYAVIMGGAKVSDKLPLLESFLGRADTLLIGGALSFPFVAERGVTLGDSHVEPGQDDSVRAFSKRAEKSGTRVLLPEDWLVESSAAGEPKAVALAEVPPGAVIQDIGPKSRVRFIEALNGARTVFWNGPLGRAEDARFAEGTRSVLASLSGRPGFHVCAGGDSARVAEDLGVSGGF
ncbi:MAG TPA: phosphoglycerate kinase, partial [Thermoplasmata archaeon]|nr:phosphoglycerate kinase [Thermoplasmata archaeon]